MFSRTKTFCFENSVFLTFEGSRHGIGHVDIQVGSCICFSVFGCHYKCTQVGSNPCRKLSLLGIAHPVKGSLFQVQGVFGRTAAH